MKRRDLIIEIKRENDTRRRVFPRWIQNRRIAEHTAKTRLERTELIEKLLENMTDQEFDRLCQRVDNKVELIQGELFT